MKQCEGHKSLQERLQNKKDIVKHLKLRIYGDSMIQNSWRRGQKF